MARFSSDSVLLVSLINLAVMAFGLSFMEFSRDDFPSAPRFVFGSGTSAFQVEGAEAEDGRTPSIWDSFAQAGLLIEDVQLMAVTGLEAYRFSISWSRLIPNGRGRVNPKGLQYYNNLINELISHGIQPHVTLVHYDIPQALEDEYGGWLSRKIVKDFTAYADACFREFGDRVSHWITINEANVFDLGAYDLGIFPPKRCSAPFGSNCKSGNSSTEPYIVAHNSLLAHASAARLYKKKYQAKQQGFIGLIIYICWFIPFTNATEDVIATQRAFDFYVGWLINPLVFGDYPNTVKKNAGSRIPLFTRNESRQVKGSYDFFGLNHYNTFYVKDDPDSLKMEQRDAMRDMAVKLIFNWDGVPTGEFPIDPLGMQGSLEYFKQNYGNPPVYIHENEPDRHCCRRLVVITVAVASASRSALIQIVFFFLVHSLRWHSRRSSSSSSALALRSLFVHRRVATIGAHHCHWIYFISPDLRSPDLNGDAAILAVVVIVFCRSPLRQP